MILQAASQSAGTGLALTPRRQPDTGKATPAVLVRAERKEALADCRPRGRGLSSESKMSQRKRKTPATSLPAKQQRAIEAALQRRAADAESIVEFVDRTSLSGDEEEVSGELTVADQHPADSSDVTFQRELDL